MGMSMDPIGRRRFLALSLALLGAPRRALAGPQGFKQAYSAEVGVLHDMFTFKLTGTIEEIVDRAGGQYRVTAEGSGPGIANRGVSTGLLRNGRWAPVRSQSWFDVRGRQSSTHVSYDWGRGEVEYHARGETFFLRRRRVVDDVLSLPKHDHVDDVMSAVLNFADGRWPVKPNGSYSTLIVRRRRADDEHPEEMASSYRAEIVPFDLNVAAGSSTTTALFDLSRFSSWAQPSRPARIVFSRNLRPELIESSMILGTSMKIRFKTV
jgi:hypothetical protein